MVSNEQKDVHIQLKTTIEDHGEMEQYETTARGRLFIRDGRHVLQFTTTELEAPTNNLYTIQKDAVSIKRSGAVEMFQKFLKEQLTENVYKHPHGIIHMETKTHELVYLTSNQTGRLNITYEVKLNGQQKRNHSLQLVYKEEK